MDFISPANNPIKKITSDAIDSPTLRLSKDICKIILGSADLADFETTFGADRSVNESLNQTIVSFPIARRNGNVLQVTGTDNKTYSFSGILIGEKAKAKKILLESIINQGIPISLDLYYGDRMQKVLIKKLDFKVETSCHIKYDIELVEYIPETMISVDANVWSSLPDFSGGTDASQDPDNPYMNSPCSLIIMSPCDMSKGTKIPLKDLRKQNLSDAITNQITDIFTKMTTCYKEVGITEAEYMKAKNWLTEFFNGLFGQLSVILSNNVYLYSSQDTKFDFLQCFGKVGQTEAEYNAILQKLFSDIFLNGCMEMYIPGQGGDILTGKIKLPIFQYGTTNGTKCISYELFKKVSNLASSGVLDAGYILIGDFKLLITQDCVNWCNGKTPTIPAPTDPFPTKPGEEQPV